jgi:DNA polymerase III epsilon subunit-like protein
MNLVFDIETNGLDATEILCMAAKDLTTNEVYRYNPNNIMEGFSLLKRSELLVGHNILGFDIPVL